MASFSQKAFRPLQFLTFSVAGNQMNDFINENWKDIYKSMSPAITEAFAQVIGSIVNNIADVLPFDALFPETIP